MIKYCAKPILGAVLCFISITIVFGQCPTSGTISSDCSSASLTITGNTLTVNPGVTVTVTGALTVRAGSTLNGTGAVFNVGSLAETYGGPNVINGGTFNTGGFSSGSGGDFSLLGVTINISPDGTFPITGGNITINNSTITGVSNVTTSVTSLSMTNTSISASGSIQLEDLTLSGGALSAGTTFSVTNGTNSIDNATLSAVSGTFNNTTMTNTTVNMGGTVAVSGASSFEDSSFDGVTNWTSNVSSLSITNTDITASGSIQLEDLTASGGEFIAGTAFNITGGTSTMTGAIVSAASSAIRNTTISNTDFDLTGTMDITSGAVTFDNSEVNVDALNTSGGTTLTVQNGSNFYVTNDMYNSEDLIVDNSYMEIGGDLDATGGDNITVRNNGELLVRGSYRMNNGGGVQMDVEGGSIVRVQGDVESTTGGNTINVDDNSGIQVDGEFVGGQPPVVSVGAGDEGADCLSGGGCCGDSGACPEASVLPVSLVSFGHKQSDSHVELMWSTASELNNEFFTLERSLDGIKFTIISTIPGAGTSSNFSSYKYLDKSSASKEKLYYRLSQTDYDGTHEYLGVIHVEISKIERQLTLYPNPVIDTRKVKFMGVSTETTWNIYSISGELVRSGQFDKDNDLSVDGLEAGTYVLKTNDAESKSAVLIIR
ncbi:T9SS type A sorting domain-containing protein [Ekhidna sp.]|uniref:T9SS type A sorting domain-containing protein n=1 Tax=Ekhidna sp. TaxID=2608089 RepID=UPI003514D3CE